MARGRRLRHPASRRRRNVSLRQSYCTPELARRHVDQHQVHRPRAEPVLVYSLLPAFQWQFFAVEPAYPRPLDYDLASVETDLALRAPPAMTAPVLAARMPWPTCHLGVCFHHRAQRFDPGRQAEPIERRRHFFPRLTHRRSRHCTRHHGRCLHGVAFLSWNRHPEPNGSRRATPLLLVQHRAGTSTGTFPDIMRPPFLKKPKHLSADMSCCPRPLSHSSPQHSNNSRYRLALRRRRNNQIRVCTHKTGASGIRPWG